MHGPAEQTIPFLLEPGEEKWKRAPGFLHPTPWDDAETNSNIRKAISIYALSYDILPEQSIPLIIHHASTLGEWIRCLEDKEGVRFQRDVSTIAWWQLGDRFVI